MPYTPAGPISIAVAAMANLLANVPYFQTWTGAGSAEAAANSIFLGEAGYPIEQISIASDVMTLLTREPHNLAVDQSITLQGAAIGPQGLNLAGTYTIVATPTANSFTVSIDAIDLPGTNPQGVFVLPASEPIACIAEEDGAGALSSIVIGSVGASIFNGAIEILFENTILPQYANDPINALAQARSEHGLLLAGIAQTQGTTSGGQDFIVLSRIESISPPKFLALPEQEDGTVRFQRWGSALKIKWGLDS